MHKPLRTLLLASLLSLPSALFARTVTPFAQPAQEKNAFAAWTPNQLRQTTTSVDLIIYLAYEEGHKSFRLEFRNEADGSITEFLTDENTEYGSILGSLSAGPYSLFWYKVGGPATYFNVDEAGCGYTSKHTWGDYGSIFGVTIGEECNSVTISKW